MHASKESGTNTESTGSRKRQLLKKIGAKNSKLENYHKTKLLLFLVHITHALSNHKVSNNKRG
jgi:hypothetical protein